MAFARTHSGQEFRRAAQRLAGDTQAQLRALLLARRQEFSHPDPDRAVDLALAAISLTTQGLALPEELGPLAAIDDEALIAELTRMVVAYFSRPGIGS